MTTPFYKGNPDIKKRGVKLEFTKEQVEEIYKCYTDITYFLSNYVYIISLDKGKVLFDTYDFQKKMLEEFNKNRFTVATLRTPTWKVCWKKHEYMCPKQENRRYL